MQFNPSYPWYLQTSPKFNILYEGMYEVAKNVSCLDIGDFFNYKTIPSGVPLHTLAKIWNLGNLVWYYDGLIYDIDKWSETKKWTGQPTELDDEILRNFIQMKMFIQTKHFSLTLIKEAMDILLQGYEYTVTVTESLMSFVINVTAPGNIIEVLRGISNYDNAFLGKPSGISYTLNLTASDE